MDLLHLALLLGCLCGSFAAEESCEGRCDKGFDSQKKCQCDDLCLYYQSCCSDYARICKAKVTRGDVFLQPEDDYQDYYDLANATDPVPTFFTPEVTEIPVDEATTDQQAWTDDYAWTEDGKWPVGPTEGGPWDPSEAPTLPGEEESLCSGQPFDAFTSLKNGSIFAFRGEYLYELDEKSARPGYPKLIRDVWGIDGPIDAAFTRVNCQGKTYLFQGSLYWRFDEGLLEPDYPRNISEGFEGIPDDLDAALALPAENYLGSERVYFFKGSRYWSYDFAHQPSRAECEQTSPSLVFDHYAVLKHDSWEEIFRLLFGGSRPGEASRARSISRDWRGLPSRLDAAMLGRIYVAQSPSGKPSRHRTSRRRHRKKYQRRQSWGRWDSSPFWESLGGISSESSDRDWLVSPCQPFQSAYFFVDDKYYRVNLHTRRVDWVHPRYPRPIAKYWLGCPSEDLL
ncbi:vitronectin [Ahaetulla prasina]|uniref:vitronectin n=1 Tax=Ahaetulla prasina TaxID=499056 RepID=UPI00264980B8|nr:vitronectin [Ahaetulla prasina]